MRKFFLFSFLVFASHLWAQDLEVESELKWSQQMATDLYLYFQIYPEKKSMLGIEREVNIESLKQLELSSAEIEVKMKTGESEKFLLESPQQALFDFTQAYQKRNTREHKVKLLKKLVSLAPKDIQKKYKKVNFERKSSAYIGNKIVELGDILNLQNSASDMAQRSPELFKHDSTFKLGCANEKGYELGSDMSSSESYAELGVMKNISFPLRSQLSCVRNQGRRGSCVSFGVTGTVETYFNSSIRKYNLSEQYLYFWALTKDGVNPTAVGLSTSGTVDDIVDVGKLFMYEHYWNYNQSQSRTTTSSGALTNSCVGYSGELCTDTYHQGNVRIVPVGVGGAKKGGGLDFTFSAPTAVSGDESNRTISDYIDLTQDENFAMTLSFAKLFLDAGYPLVTSTYVGSQFRAPDSNGYITYVAGEVTSGGHAVSTVGYIDNEDLPEGAPEGSGGGYFIVRNSWGGTWADGGYVYLPYDTFKDYGKYFLAIW